MTRQDDKLANLNLRNVAGEVIHHLEAGKVMVPFSTLAVPRAPYMSIDEAGRARATCAAWQPRNPMVTAACGSLARFTTQAIAGSTKVAINSDTLRHYKNGATIWIPPTIVGHHRMGTIVHDYPV